MKHLLHFLFILSLISINTFAQNPFEQYNYKPKVATLSQGEYYKFHDQDTLVQIGSVILNTKTQEIVAFVKKDTLYSEATLEPDIVSRWLSPDPLAEKYTSWSPYNYVMDNPIIFIDPDRRDVDLGNLYDKDEDGNYLYKRQILSFELFASTKTGAQFLKKRAQKGFELKGVYIKSLSINSEEGGELSSKIDANFQVTDLDEYEVTKPLGGADGLTEGSIINNKLSLTYHMDDGDANFFSNYSLRGETGGEKLLESIDTWSHEILLNGSTKENNFLKGQYDGQEKIPHNSSEHLRQNVQQSLYYKKKLIIC
ncbi:hypothetical protein [Flammeovirga sp. EKP202]|uniref:hypothetical protein n=1 Tax=Flammeovirga sp. EKP202 TaxID=2770592 RepID=UPI00165EE84F|nr:hypothetical protein [Flammeovirga sp. EKP202]MBD0401901.1 hypothetical protein [Flammeovirga sp. EKP202]